MGDKTFRVVVDEKSGKASVVLKNGDAVMQTVSANRLTEANQIGEKWVKGEYGLLTE